MGIVVSTLIVSLVLAFILGVLLGVFKKVFYVEVDETVSKIREVLPGANCGGCGYPGCDGCADAIAAGEAPVTACTAGGANVAALIGEIMGVSADVEPKTAVLLCRGAKGQATENVAYRGVHSCRAASISGTGTKMCESGCLGFGDCEAACAFGAIAVGDDGIPHIDPAVCVGCGVCVANCPQHILALFPAKEAGALVFCSCKSMKRNMLLKNCKAACIKCSKCARGCHTNAITMDSGTGLPVVDRSLCDSCGACTAGCPTGAIALIQKRATANLQGAAAAQ